jgi:hypothetical protein
MLIKIPPGISARGDSLVNALTEVVATVRITEADLTPDVHAVLTKDQEGVEVIVELSRANSGFFARQD